MTTRFAARRKEKERSAYLEWIAENKKQARIDCDATTWEFNIDYYDDTGRHAPAEYRMKRYWPRWLWWRIFGE